MALGDGDLTLSFVALNRPICNWLGEAALEE